MGYIQTNQLKKIYPMGKTQVNALRGVDLEIRQGEYLCVAGPSGAGKSTLLNLLGLLDSPTSGEIWFGDRSLHGMTSKDIQRFRREHIAFIFQSFNLVPVLNAWENIEFPLLIQKVPKLERINRIASITEAVGIYDFHKHRPDELSGGQRQRVAIARALVTNPKLIIADEPTANLDSHTGKGILNLLRQLNQQQKTTLVIASHDDAVMKEAGRMIHIIDGQLVTGHAQ